MSHPDPDYDPVEKFNDEMFDALPEPVRTVRSAEVGPCIAPSSGEQVRHTVQVTLKSRNTINEVKERHGCANTMQAVELILHRLGEQHKLLERLRKELDSSCALNLDLADALKAMVDYYGPYAKHSTTKRIIGASRDALAKAEQALGKLVGPPF